MASSAKNGRLIVANIAELRVMDKKGRKESLKGKGREYSEWSELLGRTDCTARKSRHPISDR